MMLHCETVGELRSALADLPDDAPLQVKYPCEDTPGEDDVDSVAVVGVDDQGAVVLRLNYWLPDCENVLEVISQCSVCAYSVRHAQERVSGRVISDFPFAPRLEDGVMPQHQGLSGAGAPPAVDARGLYTTSPGVKCPGSGLPPRAEGGA